MGDDDYNMLEYLRDVIGRGVVGGGLGSPVDIADLVAQYGVGDQQLQTLVGPRDVPAPRITDEAGNPLGGSEWLGNKMADYGIISDERNPVGEVVAGIATGFAPALRTGAAKLGRTALPYLERAADVATPKIESFVDRAMPGIEARGGLPWLLAQDLARGTTVNVIKPKGGQWLSGSVEELLAPLKKDLTATREAREIAFSRPDAQEWLLRDASVDDWIDKQLTRYVKTDMATPDDPIRLAADAWPARKAALLEQQDARIAKAVADQAAEAARRGVPIEMLTQSREDILRLQKQRELIANQTGLHFEPEFGQDSVYRSLARERQGFSGAGEATTPKGSAWEAVSDERIHPGRASFFLDSPHMVERRAVAANPWLAKVPPDTKVYALGDLAERELGFSHLIDELRNAVNPDSGLPPELLLKYQDLPKKRVQDAVEHVDRINAWRAAQKAEANAALANNAATQMVKEYPEGYRWVELRDAELDPKGGYSPELEDALRYEGDTLGHCVGGYCEDVASGHSRIFSLRDAKGQPHVTIEVGRDTSRGRYFNEANDPNLRRVADMTDDELQATIDKMGLQAPAYHTVADIRREANDLVYRPGVPYWLSKRDFEEPQPRIVQIKGKGNRKPNPEYIPFVQDFVKTQGQWSDVGDFGNTDLVDLRRLGNEPFVQRIRDRYKSDYVTKDEWDNPDLEGYAEGGSVDADPFLPDVVNDAQFRQDVRQNAFDLMDAFGDKQFWRDVLSRALAPSQVYARENGYAEGGAVDYDDAAIAAHAKQLAQEMGL